MRHTALILTLSLTALPAVAADTPARQLNTLLGKVSSMEAAFTQNTLDPQGKPLQTLSGHMKVRRLRTVFSLSSLMTKEDDMRSAFPDSSNAGVLPTCRSSN